MVGSIFSGWPVVCVKEYPENSFPIDVPDGGVSVIVAVTGVVVADSGAIETVLLPAALELSLLITGPDGVLENDTDACVVVDPWSIVAGGVV